VEVFNGKIIELIEQAMFDFQKDDPASEDQMGDEQASSYG